MEFSKYLLSLELDDARSNAMLNSTRIMAISPHPDDSELIGGGFLAEKANTGAQIKLIVISDGRKGSKELDEDTLANIRRREQEAAMNVLGVKEIEFMGFRDTEVPNDSQLRDVIIEKIRTYEPELVITVDPFLELEVHPDHIFTGKAVLQSVLFYEFKNIGKGKPGLNAPIIALGGTNKPNVILNCEKYMDVKIRALRSHKSQFDEDSINMVNSLGELVGRRINSRCGEPFRVLYPHELHMNITVGMQPW